MGGAKEPSLGSLRPPTRFFHTSSQFRALASPSLPCTSSRPQRRTHCRCHPRGLSIDDLSHSLCRRFGIIVHSALPASREHCSVSSSSGCLDFPRVALLEPSNQLPPHSHSPSTRFNLLPPVTTRLAISDHAEDCWITSHDLWQRSNARARSKTQPRHVHRRRTCTGSFIARPGSQPKSSKLSYSGSFNCWPFSRA
jgi:hypothetical protein